MIKRNEIVQNGKSDFRWLIGFRQNRRTLYQEENYFSIENRNLLDECVQWRQCNGKRKS